MLVNPPHRPSCTCLPALLALPLRAYLIGNGGGKHPAVVRPTHGIGRGASVAPVLCERAGARGNATAVLASGILIGSRTSGKTKDKKRRKKSYRPSWGGGKLLHAVEPPPSKASLPLLSLPPSFLFLASCRRRTAPVHRQADGVACVCRWVGENTTWKHYRSCDDGHTGAWPPRRTPSSSASPWAGYSTLVILFSTRLDPACSSRFRIVGDRTKNAVRFAPWVCTREL